MIPSCPVDPTVQPLLTQSLCPNYQMSPPQAPSEVLAGPIDGIQHTQQAGQGDLKCLQSSQVRVTLSQATVVSLQPSCAARGSLQNAPSQKPRPFAYLLKQTNKQKLWFSSFLINHDPSSSRQGTGTECKAMALVWDVSPASPIPHC